MNQTNTTLSLPWYFRPWLVFIGYMVGGFGGPILWIYQEASILRHTGFAIMLLTQFFWVSWSTLLYHHLAPHVAETSKHRPGRMNQFLLLLIIPAVLLGALSIGGINQNDALGITDILGAVSIYAFFRLNWRACDLLVELEGRETFKHPDPVLRAFLAMLYLPFFVFWFAKRLRKLKADGKV